MLVKCPLARRASAYHDEGPAGFPGESIVRAIIRKGGLAQAAAQQTARWANAPYLVGQSVATSARASNVRSAQAQNLPNLGSLLKADFQALENLSPSASPPQMSVATGVPVWPVLFLMHRVGSLSRLRVELDVPPCTGVRHCYADAQ